MIKVRYITLDGVNKLRKFKTLAGARKFALEWVGPQDVEGGYYAVSDDGVGKVTWQGCTRRELFGDNEPDQIDAAYKADKAALDAAYAKAVASGSQADNEFYLALKAEFDWTYEPSKGMNQ
jgi:hypothetical protein